MKSRSSLVLLLLALTVCGRDSTGPSESTVESVLVTPASSTVAIGAQVDLNAQVVDQDGNVLTGRSVHWSSEDESIATVSDDGVVTARKIGSVQVAASAGGQSGLALITVTAIPVASVNVAPGNKSLLVGEGFQLAAETRDASGRVLVGRTIAWSSNNESVATVSAKGLVTALAPGGAIITAASEGKSAPASITVAAVPVASVQVLPGTQGLVEGQTAQLQAQPMDAAGKPLPGRVVLWSTSNAAVATVTSTGLVTAQAPGSATIIATSEGKSGTTAVTVTARPPNAVVVAPAQVIVQQGNTAQLSVQVFDDRGQVIPNATVNYSSTDNAVATVSSSGLVTGVSVGRVTISASSGGKIGTAQVSVTPIPVTSVTVSPASPVIVVGKTVTLTAQATSASGQPLAGRNVTWSSSTAGVATVSASGVVTGVSAGSTVVFASIDGVLGWTTVTVIPVPVANVVVSPPASSVTVGQTVQLSAQLTDASGNTLTGRIVSWSSNQASVATVTNTGVVTGVVVGSAVITATSEGQTGTATITVTAPAAPTVTVTPDTATIAPLGTLKLTATVRDGTGAVVSSPVSWTTSNALIAIVASDGTVSALLPGVAVITATSGTASGSATITVK